MTLRPTTSWVCIQGEPGSCNNFSFSGPMKSLLHSYATKLEEILFQRMKVNALTVISQKWASSHKTLLMGPR
jgi:hypothetical protein